MLVKSTKFVNLCNNKYHGFWAEYVLTIPFVGEDVEIPVSKQNSNIDAERVVVTVLNNEATFEVDR